MLKDSGARQSRKGRRVLGGEDQRFLAELRTFFQGPGGVDWSTLAAELARLPTEQRARIGGLLRAVMLGGMPAGLRQFLLAAEPSSQAGCASPTREVAALCDDITPHSAALCDGSTADSDDITAGDLDAWGRWTETLFEPARGLPGAAASDAGEPPWAGVRCVPARGLPDAAASDAEEPPLAPGRTPPCRAARERSRTPARTSRARGGGGVQPRERAHAKNSPQ